MTKEVWFIRHGESVSNANLPTTHPAASELTEKGRREAEYVARAFRRKPDLVVVSPYIRARQTAVPTINRFDPVNVEIWPVEEFTYLHANHYNGTTGHQRGPAANAFWDRLDPWEKEGGTGESFAELLDRVQVMEAQLWHVPDQFVTVFSHGLFLRAFLWMNLTGNREPSSLSMARYLHFSQGVSMPNVSILKTQFLADGRILFSPFDTDHVPEMLGVVDE